MKYTTPTAHTIISKLSTATIMSKIQLLGTYRLTGNEDSYQIVIPPSILNNWYGTAKEDQISRDESTKEVYVYTEDRDGKMIMIVSTEPFQDFSWMDQSDEMTSKENGNKKQ